jgi:hypothetical protein
MGVRCKGSGCGQTPPPENIDELEIHVSNNPLYHWSKYPPPLGSSKFSKLTIFHSHLQES